MISKEDLGKRVMILGPSNSGKSTLALALERRLGFPVFHLDRMRHFEGTNWAMRPDDEFEKLHQDALDLDFWIIEGNYSTLINQRLQRSTFAILLTSNRWLRVFRYLQRTVFQRSSRAGGLDGSNDRLTWGMIDWILFKSSRNDEKYLRQLKSSGVPYIFCDGTKSVQRLYRELGL